jgi:hypothetical protein
MWRMLLAGIPISVLMMASCGGGGTVSVGAPPTLAPHLEGEVTKRGVSSTTTQATPDELYVRVVVTNPNPAGTDVETIRCCLKHDPQENSPLSAEEARAYLDPVPSPLPANVDVQSVGYVSSPQIVEIRQFKGAPLAADERYWISAVFVAGDGTAGPVTTPQRFKLVFMYQLVEPPQIGMLKTFQGVVKAHTGARLPNAFVQYFHEGRFLEAAVTEDDGTYYFEVIVPNPTGTSALRGVSCEESDDPTDYVLQVYHPHYLYEVQKYLLPEYVHYYVDFCFPADWHDQGGGCSL